MTARTKEKEYKRSPLGELLWKSSKRGATRSLRHGNWRQTYVDCCGMCIARVNGSVLPCGETDTLELHEIFGENRDSLVYRFQMRVILCNHHHALVEDKAHQFSFIANRHRRSILSDDVDLEIFRAGGVKQWAEKWNLDLSRSGILMFSGPQVNDYDLEEIQL